MDSKAIYKLADEITEQQVDNILSTWDKEKIGLFNSLVRLGDSRQLACATVMLSKPIDSQTKENYRFAYEN